MIKNIIFDFDGVLVDSEVLVARAFCKYLKDLNIDYNEEKMSKYAGKKTVQVIAELSKKFNINNQQQFFDDIMNIANDIYSKDLQPISGVKDFIDLNNFNYFIGSNSIKERILIGLKKVEMSHFFNIENIFSFDMVNKPKPEPDIYLEVIKHHNLKKNETVIIEDSAVGVQAGVAAGIPVVGFIGGGHWKSNRSPNELLNAGSYKIIESYKDLFLELTK